LRFNSIQKNDFVEVFKNLARYRSENNFLRLSNNVGNSSMMSNTVESFNILTTSLSVLYNYYFDNVTKCNKNYL